jgi:hypothetical protein
MKLYRLALLSVFLALPALAHDVALTITPGSCPSGTTCGATTGYNVKRGTTKGGPYATIQALSATQLSYDDASAAVQAEGQHFFYVVSATGPGGESANSPEFDALIPFSPAPAPGLSGVVH